MYTHAHSVHRRRAYGAAMADTSSCATQAPVVIWSSISDAGFAPRSKVSGLARDRQTHSQRVHGACMGTYNRSTAANPCAEPFRIRQVKGHHGGVATTSTSDSVSRVADGVFHLREKRLNTSNLPLAVAELFAKIRNLQAARGQRARHQVNVMLLVRAVMRCQLIGGRGREATPAGREPASEGGTTADDVARGGPCRM